MTLRKLCELLGWDRLRRWADAIEKIISESNDLLQENHRLREQVNSLTTSQSTAHQALAARETAVKQLETETRRHLREAKEAASAEMDRLKTEYLPNALFVSLTSIQTDNKVGLKDNGHILERYWHVPRLDGRYLLYLHRLDGPAWQDIASDGTIRFEKWMLFNARHRLDGPAYINHRTGKRKYYLDGIQYSRDAWADAVEKRTGQRPPDEETL